MAAPRRDQHHLPEAGLVSMSELLHQIRTNRKHFELHVSPDMRFCKRIGYSVSSDTTSTTTGTSSTSSPLTTTKKSLSAPPTPTGFATELPLVRNLDVDTDTVMLLCCPFPVMKLQAIRTKVWTWFSNLVWPRPPLPCVMTTCGPVFHVRSCEFHPLTGALPYKRPVRRSLSLPQ